MKESLKTLAFAAVLGIACAGLLTAANQVLGPYQEANRLAEKWRNVFEVLDVPYDADAKAEELLKLVRSDKNPNGIVFEAAAGDLKYYQYTHPDEGVLRAVEFEGPGLWGPVKGLICMKGDLKTIFRISFYEHEETPGLGGEIETPEFRGRFEGKTIAPPDGKAGIRIVRGRKAAGTNEIDAISGATMTCDKVETMLNVIREKILARRGQIRKEGDNE
jgi:Na+-transporting NADH:ubiquinone oxidoreductase subunit C